MNLNRTQAAPVVPIRIETPMQTAKRMMGIAAAAALAGSPDAEHLATQALEALAKAKAEQAQQEEGAHE